MSDVDQAARTLAAHYISQAAQQMATKSAHCKAGGYRAKANGFSKELQQQLAYCGAFSSAESVLRQLARGLTGREPHYPIPEIQDAEPTLFDTSQPKEIT